MTGKPTCDLRKLLVAIDFSSTSERATDYAIELAEALDARVVLLHVVRVPAIAETRLAIEEDGDMVPFVDWASSRAAERLSDLADSFPDDVHVTTDIAVGSPGEMIVRYAAREGCGLIIMGTRGRSGIGRLLLGSVAERTVRTAGCPVLTIRAAEEDEADKSD